MNGSRTFIKKRCDAYSGQFLEDFRCANSGLYPGRLRQIFQRDLISVQTRLDPKDELGKAEVQAQSLSVGLTLQSEGLHARRGLARDVNVHDQKLVGTKVVCNWFAVLRFLPIDFHADSGIAIGS